jgi:hypothetical protein
VGNLEDRWDVPLAALENLRANGREELGHSFAVHGHRRGSGVERNTRRLLRTFEAASGRYGRPIDPADRCGPLDLPINATDGAEDDGGDAVDISLSRLDDPTPGTRRERLVDIAKLWECQGDRKFRPLVLMVSPDNTELQRIDGLEDVTSAKFQPEDVTASSSPVDLVEVNR